jgi:aminopeptidase N
MSTRQPVAILRTEYQPPNWLISHTRLHIELDPVDTRVTSRLTLVRQLPGPLILEGVDLTLESIAVEGEPLAKSGYALQENQLVVEGLADACELTIVTRINPDANTALEGLYRTSGNFCTQCEAQGFRKITWYLDRPDVLSIFDVTIDADAADYPVLLCNGNIVGSESLGGGRHRAHWHDPFPKPCYLFALVAGDLAHIEDSFTTRSGRTIQLFIYVQVHNIDKCRYAMQALQRSMRWDEDVYGLEYDLDRFMIVAVDDFNMGAMENKGLNIFNSKFVLADSRIATDSDFLGVESVVAHEYFHNWTGNRVTCRDWFQLSLKEGLTVFRDQEFSSDMHTRDVKRIEDVRLLRAMQFPEDSGPMAHAVRPDSYIEINNFYTLTVYEKGAEIVRMIHTLLGPAAFRQGVDLYFERHDGQAVTCDDFVLAMQTASGVDLEQFRQWYSQAGTPTLRVTDNYDEAARRYTLNVRQDCPDTPGQVDKPPLHIPFRMGLLGANGKSLPLSLGRVDGSGTVLDVTRREQQFHFDNVRSRPLPSLLRGFSAPVRLIYDYSDETLAFLMAHDVDAFNRWEAGQRLAQRVIENSVLHPGAPVSEGFIAAFGAVLEDESLNPALKAEALALPSISTLADAQAVIDITAIDAARMHVQKQLAERYQHSLSEIVRQGREAAAAMPDAAAMAQRSLSNTALSVLTALNSNQWLSLATAQFHDATNMTDRVAALGALCHVTDDIRDACLAEFYTAWQAERLVIDKWFSLQAMSRRECALEDVLALTRHAAVDIANPNRLRSLIGAFAMNNPLRFHAPDGSGYDLLVNYVIELDRRNPQIAARLVSPLVRWRRYKDPNGQLMQQALRRIADAGELSPDVFEIVSRSLAV